MLLGGGGRSRLVICQDGGHPTNSPEDCSEINVDLQE